MARLTAFDASLSLAPCEVGQIWTLPDIESHHLSKSLRARPGDPVFLLDGKGARHCGIISAIPAPERVEVRLTQIEHLPPPATEIVIAQALLKGRAFENVIKMSTEMGVGRILPVETRHVERGGHAKMDKWTRILQEACKQSGNPWLPEILPVQNLEQVLNAHLEGLHLVAALHGNPGSVWEALTTVATDHGLPGTVFIWVGPEGDFAEDEIQALLGSGAIPVSLGPHILRSETAGPAAVLAVQLALEAISRPGKPDPR